MRLEENPRAMCYNLYCDTESELAKMKQMLERPINASSVIKNIDSMIYADTDSIKLMKTKLNSEYGRAVMINNNYIVIHIERRPAIIFKPHIVSIRQGEHGSAEIQLVSGAIIITDEEYSTVVRLIL